MGLDMAGLAEGILETVRGLAGETGPVPEGLVAWWNGLDGGAAAGLVERIPAALPAGAAEPRLVTALVELAARGGCPATADGWLEQSGVAGAERVPAREWGPALLSSGLAWHRAGETEKAVAALAGASLCDPGCALVAFHVLGEGGEREALGAALSGGRMGPCYASVPAEMLSGFADETRLDDLLGRLASDPAATVSDRALYHALSLASKVDVQRRAATGGLPVDRAGVEAALEQVPLLGGSPWVVREVLEGMLAAAAADLLAPGQASFRLGNRTRELLSGESGARATPEEVAAELRGGASLVGIYVRLGLIPALGVGEVVQVLGGRKLLLCALSALQLLAWLPAARADDRPQERGGDAMIAVSVDDGGKVVLHTPLGTVSLGLPGGADEGEVEVGTDGEGDRASEPGRYEASREDSERIREVLTALKGEVERLRWEEEDEGAVQELGRKHATEMLKRYDSELQSSTRLFGRWNPGLVSGLKVPAPNTEADVEVWELNRKLLDLASGAPDGQKQMEALLGDLGRLQQTFEGSETLVSRSGWTAEHGDVLALLYYFEGVIAYRAGDGLRAGAAVRRAAERLGSLPGLGPRAPVLAERICIFGALAGVPDEELGPIPRLEHSQEARWAESVVRFFRPGHGIPSKRVFLERIESIMPASLDASGDTK